MPIHTIPAPDDTAHSKNSKMRLLEGYIFEEVEVAAERQSSIPRIYNPAMDDYHADGSLHRTFNPNSQMHWVHGLQTLSPSQHVTRRFYLSDCLMA